MKTNWIRSLFIITALYDGVLGVAFLLFPLAIFQSYGVEPPNHVGYVQFPALLLLTFAAMFVRIASDPVRHRELMLYGVALKAAYVATVLGHSLGTGIPSMWIPWAWVDFVFLMLFLAAWNATAVGLDAKKAKRATKATRTTKRRR